MHNQRSIVGLKIVSEKKTGKFPILLCAGNKRKETKVERVWCRVSQATYTFSQPVFRQLFRRAFANTFSESLVQIHRDRAALINRNYECSWQ